jgi:hypothetical protein
LKVLFDHNVPSPLARYLRAHYVKLADEIGWARISNGKLLDAAERSGFNVLLSGDQTIRYEQNMDGRKIGIVQMSDNHWNIVKDYVPAIVEAIEKVAPGQVLSVFCGKFIPRKFRRTEGPSA